MEKTRTQFLVTVHGILNAAEVEKLKVDLLTYTKDRTDRRVTIRSEINLISNQEDK